MREFSKKLIKIEAGGGRSLSGELGLVERVFVGYKSRVYVVKSILCDIENQSKRRVLVYVFYR